MENNEIMEMDNEVEIMDETKGVSSGNYWTTAVAGVLGCALGAGAVLLARKKAKKDAESDEPAKKTRKPFWRRKAKNPDIIIEVNDETDSEE